MSLPLNIDDLIHARTIESARIELKRGWNPGAIVRTICAFANDIKENGGGYIIVGIEENEGTPILPPNGINEKEIDAIQKEFLRLCHLIRPKIFPEIEIIDVQGKLIIVIWVTTGEERPYHAPNSLSDTAQWQIYVRVGSTTVQATPQLERQLRHIAVYKHFDDKRNSQANLMDLDLGLIRSYLQEVKSQLADDAAKIPFEELCLKMQIIRGQVEDLKPLNVALLLFCNKPERFFEGCRTNLIEFEDEAGIDYSEKTFTGPIHLQIRNILSYLKSNIIKRYVRKSSFKAESDIFDNYPFQALEETIVNSLYHRSYEDPRPNEIRIYKFLKKEVDKTDDTRRIEIRSYPGPLPPIDNQALSERKFASRNYRNLKLGDWLKNLRLAEKYATGIPTIFSELEKNGSPKPMFWTDDDTSEFLVTIKIHEDTPPSNENTEAEFEDLLLTNTQQNILEKIKNIPMEIDKVFEGFEEDIAEDINLLQTQGLLSNNLIGNIKIIFITSKGIEVLKRSF